MLDVGGVVALIFEAGEELFGGEVGLHFGGVVKLMAKLIVFIE